MPRSHTLINLQKLPFSRKSKQAESTHPPASGNVLAVLAMHFLSIPTGSEGALVGQQRLTYSLQILQRGHSFPPQGVSQGLSNPRTIQERRNKTFTRDRAPLPAMAPHSEGKALSQSSKKVQQLPHR
jgi:hypothetical protein